MGTAPLQSTISATVLARFPRFVVLHAIPVAVIAATIACEYVVRTGKSSVWLEGSDMMQAFQTGIQIVRMLAASMALGTWTWYAGAVRVEDAPSAFEAVHTGWTSCVRVTMTVLPLLLLSVLYVFLVCAALRLSAVLFAPVAHWAVALCVAFILACAAPPCVFVVAKYALLVPLTVFEKAPPLPAIAFAGARMTLRTMLSLWFMLGLHAAAVLACMLLPAWCYVDGIWTTLSPVCSLPCWILVRQLAGLGLFVVGAPVACASMATLYFIVQPPAPEPRSDNSHD